MSVGLMTASLPACKLPGEQEECVSFVHISIPGLTRTPCSLRSQHGAGHGELLEDFDAWTKGSDPGVMLRQGGRQTKGAKPLDQGHRERYSSSPYPHPPLRWP